MFECGYYSVKWSTAVIPRLAPMIPRVVDQAMLVFCISDVNPIRMYCCIRGSVYIFMFSVICFSASETM